MLFRGDIDFLYVSRPELKEGPEVHPKGTKRRPCKKETWHAKARDRVKQNIDDFALRNGMSAFYLD